MSAWPPPPPPPEFDADITFKGGNDRIRADQERMLKLLPVAPVLRSTATQLRYTGQLDDSLMEQTYEWARVLERRADQLEGK